ncbi:hypothetical protein EYZ11_005391 [Aspergillus tanneri]|uniref:SprT-like domain-containing protein n=1 Tax=Aspergillus tanneri TaxID=1220188 RepID=A0A4S3JKJ6_9EURO|nr:uncharacterized protein ATNIH1004_002474 [Aspergillus tanneri]KAA8649798.1 hypothetical protein ATNIH1004_002474 [Aspergillus tanneri]THC95148.1 hypothetical protein EYZ11_005391 [Aspergillus tanneri]
MARLNTTNPNEGEIRDRPRSVRMLGQRGVLQSRSRETPSASDLKGGEETQWTADWQPQRKSRHQRSGTMSSGIFDIFSDSDGLNDREDNDTTGRGMAPLDLTRANSLLRRPSQRSRHRTIRKSENYNYDKENDPVEIEESEDDTHTQSSISRNPSDASTRRSPVRSARQTPARTSSNRPFSQYRQPEPQSEDEDSGDNGYDSLDDFIVSDNDEPSYHETSDNETEEEEEIPPPKPRRRLMRGRRPNPEAELMKALQRSHHDDLRLEPSLPTAIALPSPVHERTSARPLQQNLSLSGKMNQLSLGNNGPSSQLQQDPFGVVRDFKSNSPELEPGLLVLETPPGSPTRNRLPSPSKGKTAIPPTPYRESVDAFWSQELTNDWIDRHSPHKVGRLLQEFEDSEHEFDPDAMPRRRVAVKEPKTPSKTALKKAEIEKRKAAVALRKSFDDKKAAIAEHFFKALDDAVTGGRIQEIAQQTGGVRITWSKTLQTTAGRASWKWEGSRPTREKGSPNGSPMHYAGIELAARIIDDEDRLINTVAHEYCHLANYMISNVTDNPHGTSFKLWGRKCKEALKDHPVYGGRIEVTTKHSYKIDWKYVWCCVDCGQSYGRHSKSIDTTKCRCGKCQGLLQQIKPKPRNMSPKKKQPFGTMDVGTTVNSG